MEDKRSQILGAAQDIFNRLGYSKTSVDDISQAVGMKKSSLYYYFKNKEDIFMCSCKDEWEGQFKLFAEEANKKSNPAEFVEFALYNSGIFTPFPVSRCVQNGSFFGMFSTS